MGKTRQAMAWVLLAAIAAASMVAAEAPERMPRPAAAQESPYAGEEVREIKGLSAEEVAGYLAGSGMGLARAAELNRYPGPMHVAAMASELGLDEEQLRRVEATERRMRERAVALGRRLVDAEAALDQAFASGTVVDATLRRRLHEIADLQAELRHAHLAAHLETRAILRDEQVLRYDTLRGYTGGAEAPAPKGHEHHHGQGGHGR